MKSLIKNHPVNFQLWTFLVMAISIIGFTVTATSNYNNLDHRLEVQETGDDHIAQMLNAHESRIASIEKNNMEMSTDLKWIKATLLEIKNSLTK